MFLLHRQARGEIWSFYNPRGIMIEINIQLFIRIHRRANLSFDLSFLSSFYFMYCKYIAGLPLIRHCFRFSYAPQILRRFYPKLLAILLKRLIQLPFPFFCKNCRISLLLLERVGLNLFSLMMFSATRLMQLDKALSLS